jgi:septum formation protein
MDNFLENLKDKTVILASQSPRRRDLLEKIGINFRTAFVANIDESYPENLLVNDIPLYIAKKKMATYKHLWSIPEYIVISADTIVLLENLVIGKPANKNEASQMLSLLSGKTHQVITGVSVRNNMKTVDFSEITSVTFKPMSKEIINYYIDNYHTLDKAGAYGIQDFIGLTSVSKINGSYFNVMGLPIDRLFDVLREFV